MGDLFEVLAIFGKKIILGEERLAHILQSHPEMRGHLSKLTRALESPDEIRASQYDAKVWLHYKFYKSLDKYIVAAVKVLNGNGFIITAYMTDRIKLGETLWKKK
ncbi:MAG: PBECR2 nuclease fold domain-containing protein [Candidatus Diapherotrites archaeon]